MKINYNGEDYYIRWQYTTTVEEGKVTTKTTCIIEKMIGEERKTVASESVSKYYEDVQNKEVARMESLNKVLYKRNIEATFPVVMDVRNFIKMNNEQIANLLFPFIHSKQFRTLVWNAYFSRKKSSDIEVLGLRKHFITEEDLKNIPDFIEIGLEVGEEVYLPIIPPKDLKQIEESKETL